MQRRHPGGEAARIWQQQPKRSLVDIRTFMGCCTPRVVKSKTTCYSPHQIAPPRPAAQPRVDETPMLRSLFSSPPLSLTPPNALPSFVVPSTTRLDHQHKPKISTPAPSSPRDKSRLHPQPAEMRCATSLPSVSFDVLASHCCTCPLPLIWISLACYLLSAFSLSLNRFRPSPRPRFNNQRTLCGFFFFRPLATVFGTTPLPQYCIGGLVQYILMI
ncbi:hypothetical protein F5148DRAFT_393616 [Russula earlei]|uniref:Uncharacterized protein n=1 Tax=Russula earlei TaxID=71964 RepID=A0ACC0U1P5_9AGAM|nr:hypothetical protein F5148DRAFT_393616 [Russula earlei]